MVAQKSWNPIENVFRKTIDNGIKTMMVRYSSVKPIVNPKPGMVLFFVCLPSVTIFIASPQPFF
jgi:hypothetical protein